MALHQALVEDELALLGDPAVILLIMERVRAGLEVDVTLVALGGAMILLAAVFAKSKVANTAARRKIYYPEHK